MKGRVDREYSHREPVFAEIGRRDNG